MNGMMKLDSKIIAIVAAVAIVGIGGGFYGGMRYAESKAGARGGQAGAFQRGGPGTGGAALRGRFGNGGGFVNGEIISKDGSTLTLKLSDGGSRIVFASASTQIAKIDPATLDDLKEGTRVLVMGDANPDGSVNAKMIQAATGTFMMGGRGGQGGGRGGAPTPAQ